MKMISEQKRNAAVQCHSLCECDKLSTDEGKNIAIHFVIECETFSVPKVGVVETDVWTREKQFCEIVDTYVVLPVHTMVRDIANEAIQRLNISSDVMVRDCRSCACYILMRHWKPLNVEYICDVSSTTLSELVGDFPNFVTLKIRFFRKASSFYESRDRLLALLSQAESLVRNESILMYDEMTVENTERSENINSSCDNAHGRTRLGSHDAINLSLKNGKGLSHEINNCSQSNLPFTRMDNSFRNCRNSQADTAVLSILSNDGCFIPGQTSSTSKMDTIVNHLYNQKQWQHTNKRVPLLNGSGCFRPICIPPTSMSPQSAKAQLKKATRERVTFDQTTELPILLRMFEKTKHPSREQIEQILTDLTPLRKGKKPLEFFNIQYWFKNARAICKRADVGMFDEFPDDHTPESDQNGCSFIGPAVEGLSPINEIGKPTESENGNESKEVCESGEAEKTSSNTEARDKRTLIAHHLLESAPNENNESKDDMKDEMAITKSTLQDNPEALRSRYLFSEDQSCFPASMARFHSLYRASSFSSGSCLTALNIHSFQSPTSSMVANGKYKRNRVFIDPTTEIPILEKWFTIETHPTAALINTICDEINNGSYRQQYQKLRPRNIQLWFKNHRAKLKRVGFCGSGRHLTHSMIDSDNLLFDLPMNLNSKTTTQSDGCRRSSSGDISVAVSPPLSPSTDCESENSISPNHQDDKQMSATNN